MSVDREVSLEELSRRAAVGEDALRPDEGRRWHCLVTNDDGINSEGLRVLAQVALEAGLEVVVAAPMDECSGASASITAVEEHGHLVVEPRTLAGLEEDACTVLAVDGLPAFIALTGMRGAFGPAPDVVLSGINNGPNTGYAVLHSGTVGAALTASTFGARAMAVSLNVRTRTVSGAGLPPSALSSLCWETAAEFARRSLPALLQSKPGTVFNVNAPNIPVEEVKGFEHARLARFGAVQTNVAERGDRYVKLSLAEIDAEYEPGTDAALIAAGYATLTPLQAVCEGTAARLPEFVGRSNVG